MLLLSRVCAEFHDKSGVPVFTVTPQTRLSFQEAPEAIREDPLFAMLLNDHSIEVAESGNRRKQLENDPEAEINSADGKAEKPAAKSRYSAKAARKSEGISSAETSADESVG